MRLLTLITFLAGMIPMTAFAQIGDQSQPEGALERTVLGQIEAFRLGDFEAAFEFASDDIQTYFGSSEAFATMVGQGFAMVVDPAGVKFLDNRPDGRAIWQKVLIRSKNGDTFVLDYQLVPAPEGWKINAVRPVPEDGIST